MARGDAITEPEGYLAVADETARDGDVEVEEVALGADVEDVARVGGACGGFGGGEELGVGDAELSAVLRGNQRDATESA